MICLGADGCKDGWIVAVLEEDLRLERYPSIGKIIDAYPDFSAFLIDIVIGLRDSLEQIRPDDMARKELKPRGSTLFPVPSRAAVYQDTYDEQKKANISSLEKACQNSPLPSFPRSEKWMSS